MRIFLHVNNNYYLDTNESLYFITVSFAFYALHKF